MARYTRHFYQTVAQSMMENIGRTVGESRDGELLYQEVVMSFARRFAEDNPHFDHRRFVTACGMPGLATLDPSRR
jgi:hypothetical protein